MVTSRAMSVGNGAPGVQKTAPAKTPPPQKGERPRPPLLKKAVLSGACQGLADGFSHFDRGVAHHLAVKAIDIARGRSGIGYV